MKIAILVLCLFTACATPQTMKRPSNAIPVKRIAEEYNGNDIAADAKYKDKEVILEGKAIKVSTYLGQAYVELRSEDGTSEPIYCYFEDSQLENVKKIQPNQILYVKGIGKGKALSISFEKCVVQE